VFWPVVSRRATLSPAMPGTLEFNLPRNSSFLLDPMDSAWFGEPVGMMVYDRTRRRDSLLWSSSTGCGEPLVATSLGAVTSPLRWWTRWVLAYRETWDTFYLVRLWLAGVLAVGLALALELPLAAAIAAGGAFMLSGQLILNMNLGMLDTDVLLPGLAWAAVVLARSAHRGAAVMAALLGAAMLLVGNPQSAILSAGLVAALAWSIGGWPGARRVASAGFVAALLAAPLLFSFADLFPRAQQVHAAQGTVALPWQGCLSVVAPWIYGSFGERWLDRSPFDFLAWLGLLPVLLAVRGIRPAWAMRGGRILCFAPVVLWGFAFGVPPCSWLSRLPLFNLIWWGKYQAVTALAIALLAGCGTHGWFPRGRRRWLPALLIVTELGCLVPRTWTRWSDFREPAGEFMTLTRLGVTGTGRDERWFGLGRSPMPHPLASMGLRDARTYFGLYPRRAYWYVRTLVTGPARVANEAVFTGPARPLLPHADRALAALGVRWILAGPLPASRPPPGARSVSGTGHIRIYEMPVVRSRARIAARAVRVPDARTALSETSVDPAADTIFVEGPPDWIGFHLAGRPGAVHILADRGAEVRIAMPGGGPHLLVLADTWEPGWRADAGSRRLRVLPANCMFRAVAVPPDAPEAVFTYDPMPLKAGFLTAGLGAGWLCALLLPAVRGRKQRGGGRGWKPR